MLQTFIAIAGIVMLLAGAMLALAAIAWVSLVSVRHLPLVGRRGKHK
jgi:hypothetical protein